MTVTTRPRIVIGATALAGLAALGGIGAVLGTEFGKTTGTVGFEISEVATTTSVPTNDSAMSQLMSLLPKGFSSSNCAPPATAPKGSLATVDCDQNSLPNGPTSGRFSLYPDNATLDAHFQTAAGEDQISPCPGGVASPGPWHYRNASDQSAGQLVCGTYQGTSDVVWSQYDKGLLGNLQGGDLDSLYEFWSNNTA
jgi:serine/threonine kinase PknH